jgi:hypothetical protein
MQVRQQSAELDRLSPSEASARYPGQGGGQARIDDGGILGEGRLDAAAPVVGKDLGSACLDPVERDVSQGEGTPCSGA